MSNTSGFGNTANGSSALSGNTTGNHNTAVGVDALSSDTIGGSNTAIGRDALSTNATGFSNTTGRISPERKHVRFDHVAGCIVKRESQRGVRPYPTRNSAVG